MNHHDHGRTPSSEPTGPLVRLSTSELRAFAGSLRGLRVHATTLESTAASAKAIAADPAESQARRRLAAQAVKNIKARLAAGWRWHHPERFGKPRDNRTK